MGEESYKKAGVNLEAAESATKSIKKIVKSTFTPGVLTDVGLFGGLFQLDTDKFKNPVLVSSADGVGTKLKVAFLTNRHNTVGQCLVNHCVNDILSQGARPLFFLDYFACGALEQDVVTEVVEGLAFACKENSCSLIGGETAEMPDFYPEGEYDLAGFIVGVVEKEKLLDGSQINTDDVIIGFESDGLHTNGYSLARRIFFDRLNYTVGTPVKDINTTVGEELLRIHRSYLGVIGPLLEKEFVTGLAHITGGGMEGNISRVLGGGLNAVIDVTNWETPEVFRFIQEKGGIDPREMYKVFNMGIGMVCMIRPEELEEVERTLNKMREPFHVIGTVEEGEGKVVLSGI